MVDRGDLALEHLGMLRHLKPEYFSVKWSSFAKPSWVGLGDELTITMGQLTTETSTTGSQPPRFPETHPLPRSTANVMLLSNRNGQHTMTGWHWVRNVLGAENFPVRESHVFFVVPFQNSRDPTPHTPMHPNATFSQTTGLTLLDY